MKFKPNQINQQKMKTHHLYVTRGILVIVFFFVFGHSSVMAQKHYSLPKPTVPLREAGSDYQEELTEMARLMGKGKTLKFYQTASTFNKKMQANIEIRKLEKRPLVYTREDAVAREWWIYYVAIAPVFAEKIFYTPEGNKISYYGVALAETEEKDRKKMHIDDLKLDIDHKLSALLILVENSPEEIARLLSRDEKALDEVHLVWAQTLMRTFFEIKKEAERIAKKTASAMHEFDMQDRGGDLDTIAKTKLESGIMRNSLHNIDKRKSHTKFLIDWHAGKLVKKAIKSFPKDGHRVQEFLMKSGYDTKEKCRDILAKTIIRDKKTEYLFKNLPLFDTPSKVPASNKK